MNKRSPLDRHKQIRARLARRLFVVRGWLVLETVWRAAWPVGAMIGAYFALALLGIWEQAPAFVHLAVFGLVLLGGAGILWHRLRRAIWPGDVDARRRLEESGGARHRPIDAVFDAPAMAAGASVLWRRHRDHMAEMAQDLPVKAPRLSLVYEDPRALRAIVLLALFIGALYAGPDAGRRLFQALQPPFGDAPRTVVLDAWLTPPDYTGKSPIVLHGPITANKAHDEAAAPLSAPVGSMLVVRLNGGRQAPVLLAGEDDIPFDTVGTVDHRLEFVLSDPDLSVLEIRQGGRSRALWPLALIPDQPPSISFVGTPTQSRRQAMRLTYVVNDDYGVTDASLTLVPLPEGAQAPGTTSDDRLEIALRGAQTRGEATSLVVYEDLTAHPFAGRLVTAVLSATDAAGQTGKSDALVFRLPERVFSHPVAKELVAIRKDMLVSPARASRETDRIDRVSRALDAYEGDLTVFAALRSAYWRMNSDSSRKAVAEVGEILWETALRLEDGQMSLATRSLRDALDQFEEALEGGEDGLDQATAALEAMMQQFLSQMARQQSETAPMRTDGTQRMQVVGSDMLQQMIRQMRDLAAAGEMDAAKAMLDQLRDIMENASANSMTAEDYERMMAASRAAEALEGLSEDQRTLLNQTSRQTLVNRLREKNGQPQGGFDSLGAKQQGLSQRLGDILQGLGDGGMEVPGGLEQALQAMEDAGRALSEQSGPGAIRGQAEAVRALDEAKGALEQMLEQAMQQMPSGNGLDPLGRPQPGMNTRGFELPDMLDARQVERILEELRQRISNPDLSDEERQYLRRLLRRF